MLEACLSATSGPGHSEDQGEEHSAAYVCARVALCAVIANTGQVRVCVCRHACVCL